MHRALRRAGCHARIAVRCSITLARRRSTPSWSAWASHCWRSSGRARQSISVGYTECSHAGRTGLSADGAACRTQQRHTPWWSQQWTARAHPIICPLYNVLCARRQAGVVHPVKIRGLERDCALALTKKARRAARTSKNGCTCHVCDRVFLRRALLVEHMAQRPPDVLPTVE
uniref:Uncharacterized protein n=1 Tax=Trypanosoma vivax (strain Y486) TaxID=1055687 RepID=G0UBE5_TRYVY|nr:hypothetical protein, conserved in T. vivax [Trypanosoma vivax Y486]